MSATSTKTVVYDDWSGGEFGTKAPDKAPDGTWTGMNMVVYRDGHIGPRPGLYQIPVTDLPTGEIQGLGFVPTSGSTVSAVWFIIGDEVWMFRATGPALDASKAFTDMASPVPEGEFIWYKESTRQYLGSTHFTNPQDKGYLFSITDATLTPYNDMPAGRDIEMYKDRMLVVDDGQTSPRIFYSTAADFEDWPVENFFDVGASWPVLQIMEFKDALCIFTSDGAWLLTGALTDTNADATLRRISETLAPQARTVVKTNEAIYYIPNSRNAPVLYNGSFGDEEIYRHLENWKPNAAIEATGSMIYGNRDIVFLSESGTALWRKNGAWTRHDFSVPVGPYQVRYFDDNLVLTDGGAEGEAPNFYMLGMNLDRPAFVDDGFARPGDDSNTPLDAWLQLPDYFTPNGEECRVRRVIVDFTEYDVGTGGVTTNNFDLTITGISKFRRPGDREVSNTQSFNDLTVDADPEGRRRRRVFNVGEGNYGGGYRILFDNIRNVAISRVLVDIEVNLRQPTS